MMPLVPGCLALFLGSPTTGLHAHTVRVIAGPMPYPGELYGELHDDVCCCCARRGDAWEVESVDGSNNGHSCGCRLLRIGGDSAGVPHAVNCRCVLTPEVPL